MTYNLSPLLLIAFSILNPCWLVFCNYFFMIEIINNICPWNYIFNFINNKNFFRLVWCVSFSKNIFAFRNSYIIANFKFRIFIINLFLKINICIILNINILIFLWYVLLYSITISFNLSIYTFFDTKVMCL